MSSVTGPVTSMHIYLHTLRLLYVCGQRSTHGAGKVQPYWLLVLRGYVQYCTVDKVQYHAFVIRIQHPIVLHNTNNVVMDSG